MASNSNRVFVSPGVYTSEKDLTFVAQSVGVTTLGLAGETLRGPAFEPIFITNWSEFSSYFGATSAEKYVDTTFPKYELPYIAKSYLTQSNQLFVTRVLGYTGYDAGPAWQLCTQGAVDCNSVTGLTCSASSVSFVLSGSPCTVVGLSDGKIYTGINEWLWMFSGGSSTAGDYSTNLIARSIDNNIPLADGGATSLRKEITAFFDELCSEASHPGGFDPSVSGDPANYPNQPINLPGTPQYDKFVSAATASYTFGCTSSGDSLEEVFQGGGMSPYYSGVTAQNALSTNCDDWCSTASEPWLYGLFNYNSDSNYDGIGFNMSVSGMTDGSWSGSTGIFSGTVQFSTCAFSGHSFKDFDGKTVATLRSRGLSSLDSGGPVYEVPTNAAWAHPKYGGGAGSPGISSTGVTYNCTGGTYNASQSNPFASFGLDVMNDDGTNFAFKVSMGQGNADYLPRVLGRAPFDKDRKEVPIFVEEIYPNWLTHSYNQGKIKGIRCEALFSPSVQEGGSNSMGYYLEEFQTPATPYVVSELRGTNVYDLFRVITIPDGDAANTTVKISIINISLERREFDIQVRDFYDTDANPIVLEKYTRCSMNPTLNSYVAKRVGTSNGEYELLSRYIMLQVADYHEDDDTRWNAVPEGFKGYITRANGCDGVCPIYKTHYDQPGELVQDPPFAAPTYSSGDKFRRIYLGFSDNMGIDSDFLQYKGKPMPANGNLCTNQTLNDWSMLCKGYHMDSGATVVKFTSPAPASITGTSMFEVGNASLATEPTQSNHPYYNLFSRKFTFLPYGGFDGWDIYRKTRSNEDTYMLSQSGWNYGACSTSQYPNASGWGIFRTRGTDAANTDYYAYLDAINTFQNPEAVNINVFATPGIDYINHSNLVEETIEMIEADRADSLYVTTTPDYSMNANTFNVTNIVQPQEAVDNLDATGIDSNYTATYYPWVQLRDNDNNVQLYLPPTYDVMRNIALTDNIAFPWFASAGYTRGIVNAVKARKKLTLDERDILYKGRINPIATYSDVGTIIWGNKTLQVRESALDRINVRRLLLQARKLISAVAVRLLFEQNDEQVRNEFLDLVNPILDSIRRERGLTDFRVVLSDDPSLIDQNTLSGKIYIKPTRSLEFIDIEFLITPTGANFEDI